MQHTINASGRNAPSLTAKVALGAVLAAATLALLSKWTENDVRRYSPRFIRHVQSLVRYAAQHATVAAQDQNHLVRLLHCTYALSYANVARRLVPAREVERIANVNLDELIYLLEQQQLDAMQRVNRVCPQLQPEGVHATATGWLG